jgi:5-methylthioadenosine/S-adenosylhomocysteine deaminase
MDADFIHTGTLLACAEMILSGTTTFCDMYLFEDQVAQAAFEAGLRCLVGEVLYDFPSPNYGDVEKGLPIRNGSSDKWKDNPWFPLPWNPTPCSPAVPSCFREPARWP